MYPGNSNRPISSRIARNRNKMTVRRSQRRRRLRGWAPMEPASTFTSFCARASFTADIVCHRPAKAGPSHSKAIPDRPGISGQYRIARIVSMVDDLQTLCAQGQEKLMATEYLQAERTLAAAEDIAWTRKDFDTLSRLYLPLQEARRQRRQRCGEGIVCLDLLARSTSEQPDPHEIVEAFPVGELLVAGWASIAPALEVRRLQREKMLYIETFLAAVY